MIRILFCRFGEPRMSTERKRGGAQVVAIATGWMVGRGQCPYTAHILATLATHWLESDDGSPKNHLDTNKKISGMRHVHY